MEDKIQKIMDALGDCIDLDGVSDRDYSMFRDSVSVIMYADEKDAEIARLRDDALRMRWLLAGNGYFMEHEMLCGYGPCDDKKQDEARRCIDEAMAETQEQKQ